MSLPPYLKYRATGLEWLADLPAQWEVQPLKRACHVFPSNVDKKMHDGERSVRLCNYTDVYYNDVISADMDLMMATASPGQIAKFTLKAGDTVITKDSETADDIAVSAHVPRDLPGVVCGYHLAILRPRDRLHGAFVKRLFDSSYARSSVAVRANGLTRVGLSQDALDTLKVPLPPLEEQIAIALFLDQETAQIDALVSEQQRLIELLNEKRQALISHAVTKGLNPDSPMKPSGVEWLGYVPARWEVAGLTKYVESVVDYRGRTPTKVEDGVLLLTARNIRSGKIDYDASAEYVRQDEYETIMSRGKPEIGDVLFTTEAPLGQVANVDRTDVALAQRIIKFRGRKDALNNEYLKYWLLGEFAQADMQRLATGSTALGIKGSKIGQLRLAVPPLEEQAEIASLLDDRTRQIEELQAEATSVIDLLQERRTALISAAVTGQIDVRGLAAVEVA